MSPPATVPRTGGARGRALLVDTGFSASPLVAALRARGHPVTVVGADDDDALARAGLPRLAEDYGDPATPALVAGPGGVDHVVPGCNDVSLVAAARVAERLGLAGHDPADTIRGLLDKARFRATCDRLGISAPAVLDATSALGRDVVVKPRRAYSGRGVSVVDAATPDALAAAVDRAREACADGGHLVEEFVDGQLHSHSAFVVDGRVVGDVWVVEHQTRDDLAVDVSHVVAPPTCAGRVRDEVEALVSGLGLVDGPVHSQVLVDGDRHRFVEVTRRCPGDLYVELVRRATGHDHADSYVAGWVGATPAATGTLLPHQHVLRLTVAPTAPTTLGALRIGRPVESVDVVPLRRRGDPLRPGAAGRAAVVFLRARDADDLAELVAAARRRALVSVVPDVARPPRT